MSEALNRSEVPHDQAKLEGLAALEAHALREEDHLLIDLLLDALDGWSPSIEALARKVGGWEGGHER